MQRIVDIEGPLVQVFMPDVTAFAIIYLERTYKGFLDAGFTVEEAQRGIKRIVETKTLAFIGELNRVQEETRKENKGTQRIRNELRRRIERTWKRVVLEFHVHFF